MADIAVPRGAGDGPRRRILPAAGAQVGSRESRFDRSAPGGATAGYSLKITQRNEALIGLLLFFRGFFMKRACLSFRS